MRILSLAVAGLAAALAATASGAPAAPSGLKVGVLRSPEALPLVVLRESIRVPGLTLLAFDNQGEVDAALAAGTIDGAVMEVLPTAILESRGIGLTICGVVFRSTPREGRYAILSAPRSGILGPEQLRKVPIAARRNGTSGFVTETLLTEAGLSRKEIVFTDVIDAQDRLEMLVAGKVRAAALADPLATLAQTRGATVVVDDSRGEKSLSQVVLAFSDRARRAKGPEVETLSTAWGEAVTRIVNDPEGWRRELARRRFLPQEMASSFRPGPFPPSLELPDRSSVERVLKWAQGRKLLARTVTYEELIR